MIPTLILFTILQFGPVQAVDFKANASPPRTSLNAYDDELLEATAWLAQVLDVKLFDGEIHFQSSPGSPFRNPSELSDLEQHVFLIGQAERLDRHLASLERRWGADLENLGVRRDAPVLGPAAPEVIPPPRELFGTEAPMEKGLKRLLTVLKAVRDKTTVRHESLLKSLYASNPGVFAPEEQEFHLRNVRAKHNRDEKIERKK